MQTEIASLLVEEADRIMQVAGDYIAKRSLESDLGPFKRSHNVSSAYCFPTFPNYFPKNLTSLPLRQTYVPKRNYDRQVDHYRCPLHYTTHCPMRLQVRRTANSTEMFAKQMHTKRDHADDRSLNITHQQRVGIHRAVRAAPLQPGSAVIDRSASFSPEKVIRVTPNRQRAVERLVRQERAKLYQPIVHGIDLDGKQGSMKRLAEEMCIVKLIRLHNSGERELDPHEPVCCGSQFSLGVSFMCLTTLHFLMNMARAKNCGWQMQGHFDGSFNFCEKSIAMLGFGMGSLGAHFNPVCFAIANGETAEAYEWTYRAVTESLYAAFDQIKPCVGPDCGHELCTLIKEHDRGFFHTLRKSMRGEGIKRFPLDKPSSDNSGTFIKFAKKEFGKDVPIQQCAVHFTGAAAQTFPNFLSNFSKFPNFSNMRF
jgi:hypothetical protein